MGTFIRIKPNISPEIHFGINYNYPDPYHYPYFESKFRYNPKTKDLQREWSPSDECRTDSLKLSTNEELPSDKYIAIFNSFLSLLPVVDIETELAKQIR